MATATEVHVPDIGDFKDVDVIEVLVAAGDRISAEDPLVTLESDKATMDVPSPHAGVVKDLKLKVGDKVSQGSPILTIELATDGEPAAPPPATPAPVTPPTARTETAGAVVATLQPGEGGVPPPPSPEGVQESDLQPPPGPAAATPATQAPAEPQPRPSPTEAVAAAIDESAFRKAHASPTVRRFARELGVDLSRVSGSGFKGRILKEDVQAFVKSALMQPATAGAGAGFALPEMPQIDFSKFGAIETQSLSRIKKISGPHLHRSWVTVPHVTQHDEADITDLESFRQGLRDEAESKGVRLTLLAFLMKASVAALKEYPQFNASLDAAGENLILKKYYHIGVAVDTPDGLVVPVIRDVDHKGVFDLAAELSVVSAKARDKKLTPTDLQGGCFTISSLGGVGGTAFTPIINAPEVAILGVSRACTQPVYRDQEFVPRLILPLSLSYDHRVIDGAQAARFTTFLSRILADVRRLLL